MKELMNAVLVRCCAHGGVVHIYVDKRSTFVSELTNNHEVRFRLWFCPSLVCSTSDSVGEPSLLHVV